MVNWYLPVCRLAILCLAMILIPSQLLFAKGGTALLTFQKVAVPKEGTQTYKVKKGDWIVEIIRRQLNVKGVEAFKTVRLVKQLNPHIRNVNRIYPGQVLRLPGGDISATHQEVGFSKAEISTTKEYTREKPALPPENRLAIIRHVVNRMNGSIMTTGSYCIPISQMGQTTIDCSKISVVELDDGSVMLIDFSNRIPEDLGKTIRASWKNYHLIKAQSHDDIAHILQKIINASRLYTMNKSLQPFIMGRGLSLRIHFFFDWMITKDTSQGEGAKPYLQGLSFVPEESYLLPKSLITYAGKKGLIITEVIGHFVESRPDVTYTIPEIPIISKTTNSDLTWNLLTTLGYLPVRNTHVKIFDMVNDGFDLSLKADLMVKNVDKQVIIPAKKLPQQFINILRDQGTEVTSIEAGDAKRSAVEKTLHAMNTPFSYKDFSFSIPDNTDKARFTITLPAIKITTKDRGNIYLIDFDMDREIYGLLHDKWGVNIVRY